MGSLLAAHEVPVSDSLNCRSSVEEFVGGSDEVTNPKTGILPCEEANRMIGETNRGANKPHLASCRLRCRRIFEKR